MTDIELYSLFKEKGRSNLTVDDQYLFDILSGDHIENCLWCGHPVKHSISSVCAGHGEFPRFVTIKCLNCAFDYKGSISYGDTYNDVRNGYIRKYYDLKEKFKND